MQRKTRCNLSHSGVSVVAPILSGAIKASYVALLEDDLATPRVFYLAVGPHFAVFPGTAPGSAIILASASNYAPGSAVGVLRPPDPDRLMVFVGHRAESAALHGIAIGVKHGSAVSVLAAHVQRITGVAHDGETG